MCKKTPLYQLHLELGGKMVPFAGYYLPVQYETGVIAEHLAVRRSCGLFDVSHMGEIKVSGPDALQNLQLFLCNDMAGMELGRVRYSPILNEQGGVVDDLVACRLKEDEYLLIVNAANKDKDFAWFKAHQQGQVEISDLSNQYAQLALQGPNSKAILESLCKAESLPAKYYSFTDGVEVAGINCLVSRTGYTGEWGYELYCAPDKAENLARALLQAGKAWDLIPCGLGARDTLRLEAGMPLYGHEMSDEISPLETGLEHFVRLEKDDFIGKQALIERGSPQIARVGLSLIDRGIAREHCPVYVDGLEIGYTTSGTHCPYLNHPVAMALIQKEYASTDTQLEIEVRGRKIKAQVVPLPFYKRPKA